MYNNQPYIFLNDDPFLRIEQIISDLKETPIKKIDIGKLMEMFCKEILKYKKLECECDSTIDELFSKKISYENQKFTAILFLRLINANSDILQSIDINFKHKLFELFDKTLMEIYKHRNIQIKDQGYQKENILKDFINDLERKFFTDQLIIENISSIDIFERKYLKIVNSSFNKLLIFDFIPSNLSKTERLVEIFKAIKDYTKCEANYRIINYTKAIELTTKIITESKTSPSYYCNEIIIKPFERILLLLTEDFSNSPHCKPAKLGINAVGKKYPFSIENKSFKINFLIKKEGEGFAYNAIVRIKDFTGNFEFSNQVLELGLINSDVMFVEFDCIVHKTDREDILANDMIIILEITWTNYDSSVKSEEFEFELLGQRTDFDWHMVKDKSPYSTEYVDTKEEFVGRKEILNILSSHVGGDKLVSSVIYGQRRVGKTSIVKTLKNIIEKKCLKDFVIFYTENGDFNCTKPIETILKLGENICQEIQFSDSKYSSIEIPKFENSFSTINDYLNKILRIVPSFKLVIIIDEFDKIPSDLYRRCEIGDAFFSTIRAISNKPNFCFILVGGERMEYIMRDQSQEINKFKSIRVDYFSKENYWHDFQDLVKKPMIKYGFDILDETVEYIYSQTAGNPFFTKVICDELFRLMVNNRDSYATILEAKEAQKSALKNAGEQLFSHFWQDGIREFSNNEMDVVNYRKKILILIANMIKEEKEPRKNTIINKASSIGILDEITLDTIKEFEDRGILLMKTDFYIFKVQFFYDWLISFGIEKLNPSLLELDTIKEKDRREEEARITSKELVTLLENWDLYNGQRITTDHLNVWLNQFGSNITQRYIFKILQKLKFYSTDNLNMIVIQLFKNISIKLKDEGYIRQVTITKEFVEKEKLDSYKDKSKRDIKLSYNPKRDDILISYLDGIGKSGAEYAKIFADKNNIYYKNVVEINKIEKVIKENSKIKILIFIDDFVGTGRSIKGNLENFKNSFQDSSLLEKIKIHIGVICGFQDAKSEIEQIIDKLNINATIHLFDILDDSDKCFHDLSKIFTNENERNAVKSICYDFGSKLVNYNELGFGDCQATIVFPNTCPNNSLPIFWKETENWKALFKRT